MSTDATACRVSLFCFGYRPIDGASIRQTPDPQQSPIEPDALTVEDSHPREREAPLPDVRLISRPIAPERFPPPASLEPLPDRKTVLVVDDEASVLRIVLRALSQENYDLIAAESGDVALEKVNALGRRIDLLVTDYVMPGMTGRQLAAELWRRDPELKTLYETGFSDLLFDQRMELEPNAAFIEKPFSGRGLVEAARLLLFGSIHPNGVVRTTGS